jgi:hypothetical protein
VQHLPQHTSTAAAAAAAVAAAAGRQVAHLRQVRKNRGNRLDQDSGTHTCSTTEQTLFMDAALSTEDVRHTRSCQLQQRANVWVQRCSPAKAGVAAAGRRQ